MLFRKCFCVSTNQHSNSSSFINRNVIPRWRSSWSNLAPLVAINLAYEFLNPDGEPKPPMHTEQLEVTFLLGCAAYPFHCVISDWLRERLLVHCDKLIILITVNIIYLNGGPVLIQTQKYIH